MNLYGLLDAIIGKVNRSVKVDTQELGETLQKQARNNISAVGKEEVCNPNLLYNWYFLNPVNQKGQMEYLPTGITIDRWCADGTTTINAGVSSTSAFYQVVSDKFIQGLLGKTITLSALDNSNLIYTTFKLPDTLPVDYVFVTKTVGDDILSVVLRAGNYSQLFRLNSGFNNLIAVKAEIGETQTLAHQDSNGNWVLNEIPKYEEELLKCRQYDNWTDTYIGLQNFSSPINLLDNSDFQNPINSQKLTSYTGIVQAIDRWYSLNNYFTLTVNNGYINLTASNDGMAYLRQKFNTNLSGKYTIAATVRGTGNVTCGLYGDSSTTMSQVSPIPLTSNWQRIVFNYNTEIFDFNIYGVCLRLSAGGTCDILNMALYEGTYNIETLPQYYSKGYSEEISACSQYSPTSGIYKGIYSMDLLWANASPTSDFAAQTLALDLQDYDFVVISCNYANGTDVYGTNLCPKGFKTGLSAIAYSSNLYIAMREATVDTTGITFGDGYRESLNASSATKNAGNCIPITVYGVKGVG